MSQIPCIEHELCISYQFEVRVVVEALTKNQKESSLSLNKIFSILKDLYKVTVGLVSAGAIVMRPNG